MRPSSKCAIVVSFYPHVTLEFIFYINNVLFFFFLQFKTCFASFSISYIICLCPGCLYKIFSAAHDFCLFYSISWFFFFFSFLFFFSTFSLINNQPTNSSTQLVVQNNRNILFLFYSIALQIMILFMTLTCNEKYEPTSSIYVCKLLFK